MSHKLQNIHDQKECIFRKKRETNQNIPHFGHLAKNEILINHLKINVK